MMGNPLTATTSNTKLFLEIGILVVFSLHISTSAIARSLNLASGSKDMPIEITADRGIEWKKNKEILIASGNARASRGGITVLAEVLRAYYRKKSGGGTDLCGLQSGFRYDHR